MSERTLILLIGLWGRYCPDISKKAKADFCTMLLDNYLDSTILLFFKKDSTIIHLILGFLQQGGNPQKPKGPLEALRPKLQVQKLNLIACNKHLLLLVLCSLGINHQVQAWMISILCDFCNNSRNHTSVFASSFTHTTELSIPDIFSLHLSFFFVF